MLSETGKTLDAEQKMNRYQQLIIAKTILQNSRHLYTVCFPYL